ncbi:MAG: hypothetical protein EA361_19390 [Bacteroidetes bacterium]|nr:MAG: hypothetical protein EA361_19390 [Bacteroidota bacterium]
MKNRLLYLTTSFFCGIFLWVLSYSLEAQNPGQHFRDIFERETSQKRQESQYANFRNVKQLSFFPDTLPLWFFQPPQSDHEKVYAIGISDPDLPPEEAFQQAFYRAMVLAVLYNSPRIEYFRDVFTSARDEEPQRAYRQRFDTYLRITASEVADSSQFWLIDNHLTRYNESIVLIGYTPKTERREETKISRISATASVLYIEAHIGDTYEPQASFDLASEIHTSGENPGKSEFNVTQKGTRKNTSSIHNGHKKTFPMFVYRYSNPSWEPFTRPLVSYHGLWGIFMPQLLEHITLTTEQTRLQIRALEEQSEPQIQNLIREVAAHDARISILGLEFNPNEILFETLLEEIR